MFFRGWMPVLTVDSRGGPVSLNHKVQRMMSRLFKKGPHLFWLYVLGCGIAGIVVGFLVFQEKPFYRGAPQTLSVPLFESDGRGGRRLIANLDRAKAVAPGRPHPHPIDPAKPDDREKIQKRVTYHVSSNSKGFRGPEILDPLPEGTVRVVCLGDSITFGHCVEDEETYPAVLQELLSRQGRFEVVNGGVPALASELTLRKLLNDALPLSPHIVVVCVGPNDLVDVVNARGSRPGGYRFGEAELKGVRERFRRNLVAIAETTRARGIDLVLATPPVTGFFPFPDIYDLCEDVRTVAREHSIPLVDLERAVHARERVNGLVLETEDTVQRLIKYEEGVPTELMKVTVQPERVDWVSHDIYDYLDNEPVDQALLVDGSHPNAAGMGVIAELTAPEIIKLLTLQ